MTHLLARGLMFRFGLAACVASALIAGQASSAMAATGRITIDVNGQKRTATIVERSRLKRAPRATIIVLRGSAAAARRAGLSRADRFLGLDVAARNTGAALAFPTPLKNHWGLEAGNTDDVAFVRALAARLVSEGIADRNRIFLAGASSGGLIALRILCEGADYVSGGAIMIANMPAEMAKTCKPARPIPMFMLNGAADPLMPYQGGQAKLDEFKETVVSAEATLAPFAALAECGKTRVTTQLPDRDPDDGSRVTVEHLTGCKSLIEVFRVDGGGHALPGRPAPADRGAVIGARNNDVDTARAVIDFFRRAAR